MSCEALNELDDHDLRRFSTIIYEAMQDLGEDCTLWTFYDIACELVSQRISDEEASE